MTTKVEARLMARINVEKDVEQTTKDLLCNAFEGGSNYWYMIEQFIYPSGKSRKDVEYPHIDVPLLPGGAIIISDKEGDQGGAPRYRLDRTTLQRAWTLMAQKYPDRVYQIVVNENHDAEDGDVFLQLALFGEVIYG